MEPAISGTLLADRYRLIKPLGSGGSATVWEAMDTSLHRAVAIKLLRGSAVNDPTERERLRREAHILASLAHPRICAIWDYVEAPMPDGSTAPVLVTELMDGQSLSQRLAAGPLPWPEAVAVCAQLADALLAAHQAGIVHRDVKPANVILVADGAKLLDFGIARAANDGDLTGNLTVGTPLCMAPEQVRGQRARPASDIYALGCVLFWSLTGHPPFPSKDVTEIFEAQLHDPPPPIDVPGLPARVIEFCHGCLSKNPALRPNAAQALTILSAFSAQLRELGFKANSATEPPRQLTSPPSRSRRKDAAAPASAPAPASPSHSPSAARQPVRGAFEPPRPTHLLSEATAAWDPPHLPPPPERAVLSQILEEQGQDSGLRLRPRISATRSRPAGRSRDRRRSPRPAALVAASLVGALAVGGAAVLLLGGNGSNAGNTSSGSPNAPVVVGGGTPSQTTQFGTGGSPTISATPAADPIAYLEAVRAQIRTFVAAGPTTLNPTTGGDLQNSIVDIENSVISAQRNGGTAHLQEIRNKISQFDGRLNGLVGKGRVSPAAAGELTVEVQRLSNTVTD
jgi:eukaryotic-like serine/threonine-protein kinase